MIFNEGIKNNASFSLIDKTNEDLFHKIKDNIINVLQKLVKLTLEIILKSYVERLLVLMLTHFIYGL